MGSRAFRAGGFEVQVRVPDRVGHLLRRVTGRTAAPVESTTSEPQTSPVLVGGRPPLHFDRRDPDLGLAFIRGRMEWREARRGSAMTGDERAALVQEVASHPWYHTIDLGDGIVTQGYYDHRPVVPLYGLPEDLDGRRVLDVASADGFWAFEFERRGGDVTALDITSTEEVDLPEPVRELARARGIADPLRDGLLLARRLLGSQVAVVDGSVYELDPADVGTFDLVHSGDLLLHLREPLRALERIRSVTGGTALISDVFDPELSADGDGMGLMRYGGGWNTAGWWVPSLDTLAQLVIDAGFSDVELVATYSLPPTGLPAGPWRAVLRATP